SAARLLLRLRRRLCPVGGLIRGRLFAGFLFELAVGNVDLGDRLLDLLGGAGAVPRCGARGSRRSLLLPPPTAARAAPRLLLRLRLFLVRGVAEFGRLFALRFRLWLLGGRLLRRRGLARRLLGLALGSDRLRLLHLGRDERRVRRTVQHPLDANLHL